MSIVQKRIRALDTYDGTSKAAASVWVAVDHDDWTETKKLALDQFFMDSHTETENYSATSTSVIRTYGTAFSGAGSYYYSIKAYKIINIKVGGSTVAVRQDVPYHDLTLTAAGFTLTLAEYTSVVVKYFMFE